MMREDQVRPRVTPQMSLKVSSIFASIRMAMNTNSSIPTKPSLLLWVFWMNSWMFFAASFCALTLTTGAALPGFSTVAAVVTGFAAELVNFLEMTEFVGVTAIVIGLKFNETPLVSNFAVAGGMMLATTL